MTPGWASCWSCHVAGIHVERLEFTWRGWKWPQGLEMRLGATSQGLEQGPAGGAKEPSVPVQPAWCDLRRGCLPGNGCSPLPFLSPPQPRAVQRSGREERTAWLPSLPYAKIQTTLHPKCVWTLTVKCAPTPRPCRTFHLSIQLLGGGPAVLCGLCLLLIWSYMYCYKNWEGFQKA